MNAEKFALIAESLRQYRRAELRDFQEHIGGDPVDVLYVDPLPGEAALRTVLAGNTTFLVGRKGTGKSTIFAKAQSEIRKNGELVSVYVDVKSLHEGMAMGEAPVTMLPNAQVNDRIFRAHMLRKAFLGTVLTELLSEVDQAMDSLSLLERWMGRKRTFDEMKERLHKLQNETKHPKLAEEEIPTLRLLTTKLRDRTETKQGNKEQIKLDSKVAASPSLTSGASTEDFEEALRDQDTYVEYADAVLRSFPFAAILDDIKTLLSESGLKRLVVFFDDFSELTWIDQKLFVDVILAPLNNGSDERVKLKIAGYPGRIYYGKIDPSKVDTLNLDFSSIYKAADIQTAEASGIEYTTRLLERRFLAFSEDVASYLDSTLTTAEYMRVMFETTFNVPRLMGSILYQCYLDRISKQQSMNAAAIRLAAQKYYDTVLSRYFDRMNRFALEPFEQKLDRHNQKLLLSSLTNEARDVRRRIVSGEIGGTYFDGLTNPPVSHFAIDPHLEHVLSSLELNFLVTKYHDMRDKDGKDVSIYALFYGLCEAERLPWGYPRGRREDRSYFVQRCFNFNPVIHEFLKKSKTIRCDECGACHPMEKMESFELFKWRCPDCGVGVCRVVSLGDEFKVEVQSLDKAIMLEPVELEILGVLHEEATAMRAGQISALLDVTHQLVGKRTTKLQQMGLVDKNETDAVRSSLTLKADRTYFDNP